MFANVKKGTSGVLFSAKAGCPFIAYFYKHTKAKGKSQYDPGGIKVKKNYK
jgi:hypothetical protein